MPVRQLVEDLSSCDVLTALLVEFPKQVEHRRRLWLLGSSSLQEVLNEGRPRIRDNAAKHDKRTL